MDWALGALNTPYVAVFKDARKPEGERAADFPAQSADLVAQMKILDGHLAGKSWFALDRLTIADMALAPLVVRCLAFPIEKPALPELSRWAKAMESRAAFAVATGAKPSALNAA
jgi:glutathione S-transferase